MHYIGYGNLFNNDLTDYTCYRFQEFWKNTIYKENTEAEEKQ